jgi:phosphomannomutase/phosphoglucomutase
VQDKSNSSSRAAGKLQALSFHMILILAASAGNYFFLQQITEREALEDTKAFGQQAAALIERQGQDWMAQTRLLAQQPSLQSQAKLKAVIPVEGVVPPSLSYAVQDLINRTKVKATGPELSINGQNILVDVAMPMPNGGYLVAEWPFAPLADDLKRITPEGYQLRLTQQVSGTPMEALRLRSTGNDGMLLPIDTKLAGWQLAVGQTEHSQMPLWAALITLMGGLLSLVPWLMRRDRAVSLPAPTPIKTVATAATPPAPTPALAEPVVSAPVVESAAPIATPAAETPAPAPAPVPTPEPAVTEPEPASPSGLSLAPQVALEEPKIESNVLDFKLDDVLIHELDEKSLFPMHLFRAYDIRGVSMDFDKDLLYKIGRALGTNMREQDQHQVVVGYDVRTTSPSFAEHIRQGLLDSGLMVIDIGQVPTPVMHHAAREHDGNGVMITASHCAGDQNGIKWVINNHPPSAEDIQAIREKVQAGQFIEGRGQSSVENFIDAYQDALLGDVILGQSFEIAIDGMNGAMGAIALATLRAAGCQVSSINTEPDGHFPHGAPDPSQAGRLDDLCNDVIISGADIGFAFDGDGDRLVVIDSEGQVVSPDQLIALYAQMVLETQPGADIIFDVKCSRMINTVITEAGGRPVMVRSGNTFIRQALQSGRYEGAFGAEFSGHYFFNDGRGHDNDDGLYAALRLLEWLDQRGQSLGELLKSLPQRVGTPDQYLPLNGSDARQLLDDVKRSAETLGDAQLTDLDGIRLDFSDGFGIMRASNTGPYLTVRFDGDSPEALQRIRQVFHGLVAPHHPTLANHLVE